MAHCGWIDKLDENAVRVKIEGMNEDALARCGIIVKKDFAANEAGGCVRLFIEAMLFHMVKLHNRLI